jgi:hypothetical protein
METKSGMTESDVEGLDSLDDHFGFVSATDVYAIFGARGPVLWSGSGNRRVDLEFSKDDLNAWRRVLRRPATRGATWRTKVGWFITDDSPEGEKEYVLDFTESSEYPGHVIAQPRADDNPDEFPIIVGAKIGNLFMIFAGSPNSFMDGDFQQQVYDALRLCGVARGQS